LKIYHCMCGYEYDPNLGDIESGIAPGISFEDLPKIGNFHGVMRQKKPL